MKFLKVLAFVQALIVVYYWRENAELKEQILSSADAVALATKKIEKLHENLSVAQAKESTCHYMLNKYNDQLINQELQQ